MEDLKSGGLVEKIDVHHHAVGHCYRCETVVEPRLSPQWFVKMKPLAEEVLFGELVSGGRVIISVEDDELRFEYESRVPEKAQA